MEFNVAVRVAGEAGEEIMPVPVIRVGEMTFKRRIAEAMQVHGVVEVPGPDVNRIGVSKLSKGLAPYSFMPFSIADERNRRKLSAAEQAGRGGSLENVRGSICLFAIVAWSPVAMYVAAHTRLFHMIQNELATEEQSVKDHMIASLREIHANLKARAYFQRIPFPEFDQLTMVKVEPGDIAGAANDG